MTSSRTYRFSSFAAVAALGAAAAGFAPPDADSTTVTRAADAPPETDAASEAVFDLYREISLAPESKDLTPAEAQAFRREWHDRLRAVADGDPRGRHRSRALHEAGILAAAAGDLPAAIGAAEAWVAGAVDRGDRSAALLRAANYRVRSLGPDAPPAAASAAADDARDALEEYTATPPELRRPLSSVLATELAVARARLLVRTNDPAAADALRAARALDQEEWLRTVVAGGALAFRLRAADGLPIPDELSVDATAADVRAGQIAAATGAVPGLAAERGVPASLAALAVARAADLGGPGGTWLRDWLANAADDPARPVALWELARADAGRRRDDLALPLLTELRSDHAEAMATLSAGRPKYGPHPQALAMLAQMLDDAGAAAEAEEVADEVLRRYPDAPQYLRLGRGNRRIAVPPDAVARLLR